MKNRFLWIAVLALAISSLAAQAQQPAEKKKSKAELRRERRAEAEARQIFVIDSLLNEQRYAFVAERAITSMSDQSAPTINSRADLLVSKEQIRSQLPFYGTLYSAKIGNSTSPLDFTSKEFKYQRAPMPEDRKGKWYVLIDATPINNTNLYRFGLEIYENGAAVLTVVMKEGTGQSFFGQIEPLPQNYQQ